MSHPQEVEPSGRWAGIGRLIRERRHRRGLGLADSARRVGVTPAYISMLETGTTSPSAAVIDRLADLFGIVGQDRRDFLLAIERQRFLVALDELVGHDNQKSIWMSEYLAGVSSPGDDG